MLTVVSASEVTTFWRYTNLFVVVIIIIINLRHKKKGAKWIGSHAG